MEAHKLKDSINLLRRKKEELELQTNESGLSIDGITIRILHDLKNFDFCIDIFYQNTLT